MNKSLVFILLLVLISCNIKEGYETVRYKSTKSSPSFKMEVPEGYDAKYYMGNHEYEQNYWYSDSMVLYITTFANTINYDNIKNEGTYYDRFKALNEGDSLTLEGVDKQGRYWKDRLMENGITIGYSKIPKSKRLLFENALSTFRKK